MPAGDRTGPMGRGPRSGRATGFCTGHNMPGYANAAPGWRHGRGGYGSRGWHRRGIGGFGHMRWGRRWETPSPAQETETLRRYAEDLKDELDAINQRIDELEPETGE